MMDFLLRFLAAGGIFAVIDAIWLGTVANAFYKSQIGSLLAEKPNMVAAVLFYIIFIVGLVVFVINPALASGSWLKALGLGALFGLVTYATYDLTNAATLKHWPLTMVVVDILWGIFLAASVSLLTYLLFSR